VTEAERHRMNDLCLQIKQEKNYQRFEKLTRELQALVAMKEHRFPEHQPSRGGSGWKRLPAVAKRLIKPLHLKVIEQVEIKISGAEELYSDIRIENSFTNDSGALLAIQEGAPLEVSLQAPVEHFREKTAAEAPSS
jgi:hypothetical protein